MNEKEKKTAVLFDFIVRPRRILSRFKGTIFVHFKPLVQEKEEAAVLTVLFVVD